jgi:hypothetical protein
MAKAKDVGVVLERFSLRLCVTTSSRCQGESKVAE